MLGGWVVVLLCLVLAPAYVKLRRRSGASSSRIRLEVVFGLYLALLVAVVYFPFRVDPGLRADDAVWDRAAFLARSVNLAPLASIEFTLSNPRRLGAVAQIGGNLILLAPLGVLIPLLFESMRRWSRMAVFAVVCSVGIEVTQLLLFWIRLSIRAIDIDDVILNVTGVMVGYLAWWVWQRVFAPRPAAGSAGQRAAYEADSG